MIVLLLFLLAQTHYDSSKVFKSLNIFKNFTVWKHNFIAVIVDPCLCFDILIAFCSYCRQLLEVEVIYPEKLLHFTGPRRSIKCE